MPQWKQSFFNLGSPEYIPDPRVDEATRIGELVLRQKELAQRQGLADRQASAEEAAQRWREFSEGRRFDLDQRQLDQTRQLAERRMGLDERLAMGGLQGQAEDRALRARLGYGELGLRGEELEFKRDAQGAQQRLEERGLDQRAEAQRQQYELGRGQIAQQAADRRAKIAAQRAAMTAEAREGQANRQNRLDAIGAEARARADFEDAKAAREAAAQAEAARALTQREAAAQAALAVSAFEQLAGEKADLDPDDLDEGNLGKWAAKILRGEWENGQPATSHEALDAARQSLVERTRERYERAIGAEREAEAAYRGFDPTRQGVAGIIGGALELKDTAAGNARAIFNYDDAPQLAAGLERDLAMIEAEYQRQKAILDGAGIRPGEAPAAPDKRGRTPGFPTAPGATPPAPAPAAAPAGSTAAPTRPAPPAGPPQAEEAALMDWERAALYGFDEPPLPPELPPPSGVGPGAPPPPAPREPMPPVPLSAIGAGTRQVAEGIVQPNLAAGYPQPPDGRYMGPEEAALRAQYGRWDFGPPMPPVQPPPGGPPAIGHAPAPGSAPRMPVPPPGGPADMGHVPPAPTRGFVAAKARMPGGLAPFKLPTIELPLPPDVSGTGMGGIAQGFVDAFGAAFEPRLPQIDVPNGPGLGGGMRGPGLPIMHPDEPQRLNQLAGDYVVDPLMALLSGGVSGRGWGADLETAAGYLPDMGRYAEPLPTSGPLPPGPQPFVMPPQAPIQAQLMAPSSGGLTPEQANALVSFLSAPPTPPIDMAQRNTVAELMPPPPLEQYPAPIGPEPPNPYALDPAVARAALAEFMAREGAPAPPPSGGAQADAAIDAILRELATTTQDPATAQAVARALHAIRTKPRSERKLKR